MCMGFVLLVVCAVVAPCLVVVCAIVAPCLLVVCVVVAPCLLVVCAVVAPCLLVVCAVVAPCLLVVCAVVAPCHGVRAPRRQSVTGRPGCWMVLIAVLRPQFSTASGRCLSSMQRRVAASTGAPSRAATDGRAAAQVCVFHGFYTWLLYTIAGVHMSYTATLLSVVAGVIPFFPAWLIAIAGQRGRASAGGMRVCEGLRQAPWSCTRGMLPF